MTATVIRLATRGSALARLQAERVAWRLAEFSPEIECRIVEIRTTGDRDQRTSLPEFGGVGVFVRELEEALRRGEADLAVHSAKDLPTLLAENMTIAAVPERGAPEDLLICRGGHTLVTLPTGARVGTSSARRAAQLLHLRADLLPVPIRGNVDTRLRKLAVGECEALIMAAAGRERLQPDLSPFAVTPLAPDIFCPAAGQGTLVVEARRAEKYQFADRVDDARARLELETEREVLRRLEAGCRAPLGVLARADGDMLSLQGMITSLDGTKQARVVRSATLAEAAALAARVAEELKQADREIGALTR